MRKPVELGTVEEVMPNLLTRVIMDNGATLIAYRSGKMKHNKISILVGDRVEVEIDPYGGKTTNRLIRRL